MIHQAAAFIVRHLVRRQPSPTAGAHDAPLVRLSCFHGDGKWTDFVRGRWAADPCAPIEAAYVDAVGRLPVDEMPDLFDCLYHGGHCVGLLDPASNVILNGLTLLCRRRSGACSPPEEGRIPLPPDPRHVGVWMSIAYRSYLGLLAFMHTYFRYLTEDQARFYLHLSGGDLLVAIRIAELEQFAAVEGAVDQDAVGRHPDLLRERAQFALDVAGIKAKHPMPDDLLLLCQPALQETADDMKAVLATLEEGRRLTVHDVEAILGVLKSQLRHRTVCPGLQLTSTQRGRGETLHYRLNGLQFQQCAPFSLASLRSPEAVRSKVESCLALVPEHTPHTPAEVADAAPTCDHIEYLKTGLLDVIHALYVEALARLPRAALRRLLRGVLVAGHCYGPMDPVSNIIIHAAWYSVIAPPLRPTSEPNVLGVDALLRLEVRSLDGLVAAVRAATGFSEHKAVEYLSTNRCDISDMLWRAAPETRGQAFRRASEAARHPLGEHHSSFLASLASEGPKFLDTLSSLLRSGEDKGPRHLISDGSITELQKMLGRRCSPITPLPAPNHSDSLPLPARKKQWLEKRQRFLPTELEQLLRGYADQRPWEPTFELEIVCGVATESAYLSSHCHHINFLAAASDGTRVLFFAQLWEEKRPDNTEQCFSPWVRYSDRESEVSFCCPLPYYSPDDAYLGRCTVCEFGVSKIVHPPAGLHIGAAHTDFGKTGPLASDLKKVSSRADGIVDTELIYCDDPTDSHFATALNESRPSANMDKNLL